MKNFLILIPMLALIAWPYFTNAQNLVPNPSFEDTVACPNWTGQIDKAAGWSSFLETPDYFNMCANDFSNINIPSNYCGYQTPRTGNAYAGLITKGNHNTHADFKEIIGIELLQQLNYGQSYFVSFYVSKAFNVSNSWFPYRTSTNKMGVRFSTIQYDNQISPTPTNNFAHLYSDSVISDTANWVQIYGHFIADSAYKYMSIGNFFTDAATTFTGYDSLSSIAYYYVDDVSLIPDSVDFIGDINNTEVIKIYPNPGHQVVYIEGKHIDEIILSDPLGRIILQELEPKSSFEIKDLRTGIYFVSVRILKKIYTQKLVIY